MNRTAVTLASWSLSSSRESNYSGSHLHSREHIPVPGTDPVPLRVLPHILIPEEILLGESSVIILILQMRNQGLIKIHGLAQRW